MYCRGHVTLLSAVCLFFVAGNPVAAAGRCQNLATQASMLDVPASITAEENTTGRFIDPPPPSPLLPRRTHEGLPGFCRVVLKLHPVPRSNIGVEVWLPATSWNRKYLGTGNSAYAGWIDYSALADGLRRGYAVANTDMGAVPFSLDGGALAEHSETWTDWGSRATNEMTRAAKKVIKRMPSAAILRGALPVGSKA
jgi:feruloyl esterase